MKAGLKYFSLLLFSNINRLPINDMLGVELKQRLSGGIMLVLTLFVLIGGNAKAATNIVYGANGGKVKATLDVANNYCTKIDAICLCREDLIISKTIALQSDSGVASTNKSYLNGTGITGQSVNATITNAGFINFSEREIL
ncbi:MAG: hypothetical protein P4L45_00615 [Ignavibacteriaceae bacterium]|nr:hypothetical protein [Ignavibacteriaceae bacterium]